MVIVAVACRRSSDRAATTPHVRIAIGGQNQLVYLPTTLAQELGFYRDEGLDVTLEDLAGGSKALEALVGGSADVVSGFYDHTIQMAADGRPLVAFVSMLRFPGLVLAVSPQSPVARIEDLKGRIAGVTTAGSSSDMLLRYLLQKHGLNPDDVSITSIGTAATAIAAMERGKVDAGMMTDPAFTLLTRRAGRARVLADLRTADGVQRAFGTTTYPASVLYAKADWLTAHADTASRLARAIQRTLQWMHAHSPQEITARVPASFRGGDDALYADALAGSMAMFSPDGVMSADGVRAVHALLADSLPAVKRAQIDLAKTYTNAFVQQAKP